MANNFTLKLNIPGVRELRKDKGIVGVCQGIAKEIVSEAGPLYDMEEKHYSSRHGYKVKPADAHGYYSNRAHQTLEKIIEAKYID